MSPVEWGTRLPSGNVCKWADSFRKADRTIERARDSLDDHIDSLPVEVVDWPAFETDVIGVWANIERWEGYR